MCALFLFNIRLSDDGDTTVAKVSLSSTLPCELLEIILGSEYLCKKKGIQFSVYHIYYGISGLNFQSSMPYYNICVFGTVSSLGAILGKPI